MTRAAAMLSLVAAMSMTGANVPLVKLLLASIPPGILLPARFLLAAAVLTVMVRHEPSGLDVDGHPQHATTTGLADASGGSHVSIAVTPCSAYCTNAMCRDHRSIAPRSTSTGRITVMCATLVAGQH